MKRSAIFLTGTAILTIGLLYFFFDPALSRYFPKCPFYGFTGLHCPGCGSQRAVSALLHGQVSTALSYNVLLVLALPLVVYYYAIRLFRAWGFQKVAVPKIVYTNSFVWGILGVVILFGVARNVPVRPFTALAPAPTSLKPAAHATKSTPVFGNH